MNFTNYLYAKSKHPNANKALTALVKLDWHVEYAPANQAYCVIDSQNKLRRIFNSKIEVINYLANL